jgi:hypothetical protein
LGEHQGHGNVGKSSWKKAESSLGYDYAKEADSITSLYSIDITSIN